VADVVEAISSHRPYRASLGIDFAIDEIFKNRGTLYDADVVDTCLKLFKEKNFSFT
jgi:HD-GYP domain-containing protein (c-di-GMP phosphodiesterase class II)